jgi:hypothetical protein
VGKKFGFTLYSTHDRKKSTVAERMIQTLLHRIYRYLFEFTTYRYLDVLPDIVAGYNSTVHSAIGQAPNSVRPRDTIRIYERLYGKRPFGALNPTTAKYSVGTRVRIMLAGKLFQKAFWGTHSKTIYQVVEILDKRFPLKYRVQDTETGDLLTETFYEEELIRDTTTSGFLWHENE